MSESITIEDGSSENEERKAMLESFQMSPRKKIKTKKPLFFRSTSSASFFRGLKRLGSTSSNCSSDEDSESSRPSPSTRTQLLVGRSLSSGAETQKNRRKNLVKQQTFCEGEGGVICSTKELKKILSQGSIDQTNNEDNEDDLDDSQKACGVSVGPTLQEDIHGEDAAQDVFEGSIVRWDDDKGVDAQQIGGAIENFLQKLSVGQTVP